MPGIEPDSIAGNYLLDGMGYVVSEKEGRLFTRITGQPELEIFPEETDRFFYKAVAAQITFVRGAKGAVSGLVLHQNGYDLPASRVDGSVVKTIEDAMADRIKHKTPLPDSEALLRRIIAEHQRGEPDFERMKPPLAALAREQSAMIKADLEKIGLLKSVSFKGVGPGGGDVHDVRFENGTMEWGFALAADGKFSGIYLQRFP
ncbi:hypothetical protein [Phyllobacterium sp. SB3]|uniref:hypothetical protein n=1 Tax=Phyllobacterium sp. SB3 TaxID=3156073 RepID=UPI0032AF363F